MLIRQILVMLLFIKTSWAADFLSEIRQQYQSLFASETSEPEVWPRHYEEELHEKLLGYEKNASSDMFPASIQVPKQIASSTDSLFDVHHIKYRGFSLNDKASRAAIKKAKKLFKNAHLDIIRAFWQGYIAFVEGLETEGQWELFASNFSSAFYIPAFKSDEDVYVEYSSCFKNEQLNESSKLSLLPVFFVHYALGIVFHEDKRVTPQMRIKALQLWKKVDPQKRFLSQGRFDFRYGYSSREKRKNLLPETFDEGLIEDQEINDDNRFYTNPHVVKLFGTYSYLLGQGWSQESFQKGLTRLLADHKQELMQILHSVIELNSDKIFGQMALKFLFKIADSNDADFLGIILGEHASYRNKGRITRVIDDLPLLGREVLIDMVRTQKRRLEEMKTDFAQTEISNRNKFAKVKQELIADKARYILGSLQGGVDYKGWFALLKVNPLFGFEENESTIKNTFRKLSLELHPDKHSNGSKEDMAQATAKAKELNEAYQKLGKKNSFNEYLQASWQRAQNMARSTVLDTYGKL